MVKQTAEDTFIDAYDAAVAARQAGSHQEEIDALREALSAAYDALYPITDNSDGRSYTAIVQPAIVNGSYTPLTDDERIRIARGNAVYGGRIDH